MHYNYWILEIFCENCQYSLYELIGDSGILVQAGFNIYLHLFILTRLSLYLYWSLVAHFIPLTEFLFKWSLGSCPSLNYPWLFWKVLKYELQWSEVNWKSTENVRKKQRERVVKMWERKWYTDQNEWHVWFELKIKSNIYRCSQKLSQRNKKWECFMQESHSTIQLYTLGLYIYRF